MAAMSDYLENRLIDWLLRGQSFPRPASVFIALGSTETPPVTDESQVFNFGHGVDEVAAPSYSRVQVLCDMTRWSGTDSPTSGVVSTGTSATACLRIPIAFPIATEPWSPNPITHLGIFDAPTGGNLLFFGAFQVPFSVLAGMQLRFPAGALSVALATDDVNLFAPAGALLEDGSAILFNGLFLLPS